MLERIIVLDGAMGTMVQKYKLSEAEFRGASPPHGVCAHQCGFLKSNPRGAGERFAAHPYDLKGDNDLLVITQPHIIEEIHTVRQFVSVARDQRAISLVL